MFRHFVLLLVTKWRKLNFQNANIFWVVRPISKIFSLLTSLWWPLSETIIRYPIISKTKFGRNFVTSFPAKMPKSEEQKTCVFFGMVSCILLQDFKWIALKLKKMNEGERFWCHICPPWRTSVSTIHHEKLWKRYRISRGNYSANCRNSYLQLRPHMCWIKNLLNVKDWGFMHTSVLRQAFPVDQETNNFVRQVHNQVFNLFYILFHLDIILPFSPISSEVLTEILDLKTTARDMTESTAF